MSRPTYNAIITDHRVVVTAILPPLSESSRQVIRSIAKENYRGTKWVPGYVIVSEIVERTGRSVRSVSATLGILWRLHLLKYAADESSVDFFVTDLGRAVILELLAQDGKRGAK